jgi:hypothetical protein
MRLKTVFISDYKHLKNFKWGFDGAGFIRAWVGNKGRLTK